MNQTTLIIGANSNVGAFLAQKLLEKNNLILHYHTHTEKIAELLTLPNVTPISFNLCDFNKIDSTFTELFKNSDLVPDNVIVTATERSTDFKKLADSDPSVCEQIINTNILGVYNCLKLLIPYLRLKNKSSVILFSSNVSRIGLPQGAIYAATKAALSNLVRSVSMEEAESNLLINAISPGPIQIDDSHFSEEYQQFRKEYYNNQLKKIPLKRLADLNDIFHTVEYLLTPNNAYITGEEFFITGGSL